MSNRHERRDRWQRILDAELKRWSAKPCGELIRELAEVHTYLVDFDGNPYCVEIQWLENTDKYVHVGIAVDDGSIPASFRPVSSSFVRQKTEH